jgi:predicted PurR-regulated permease PerM
LRKPRWVAAVLTFGLLLLALAIAALLVIPPLLHLLEGAASGVQPLLDSFAKVILKSGTINVFGQSMNATQLAQAGVSAMRAWISHPANIVLIGSSAAGGLFGGFVSLVLLFYFLLNGPQLVAGAIWLAPRRRQPLLHEVCRRLAPLVKRYFIGVVITVAYATCAAYLGLGLVLRIHHAVVLAILTGVLEIIPVFGPASSAVLAGLAAVQSAKSIGLIIGYAIYAIALRLSIDQFIGPIALGTAARMNPTVIIFCFFTGGVLFGLIGIILAVPTALAVRVTLSVVRDEPGSGEKQHEMASRPGT